MKIWNIYTFLICIAIIKSNVFNPQKTILEKMKDKPDHELFKTFHFIFNKKYDINSEEGKKRLEIFKENRKFIDQRNIMNLSYKLEINQFTDMTFEEFTHQFGKFKPDNPNFYSKENLQFLNKEKGQRTSEKINWTNSMQNAQYQGRCGSCYAFATVASIEGLYKIKYGIPVKLSEQQIVDCDGWDFGCNGGWPSRTLDYLKDWGNSLSSTYPYTSGPSNKPGSCIYNRELQGYRIIQGYETCDYYDCSMSKLIELLKQGPLIASIWVFQELMFYSSGVLNPQKCYAPNHAINIIGIDSDEQGEYFIVRNSWGDWWGDKGNFKIRLNSSTYTCNVASIAWLPKITRAYIPDGPIPNPDPPQPTPEPVPTPPKEPCPVMYEHCPFTGRFYKVCDGAINLGVGNMDKQVSSFKIGDAKSITLYERTRCRGESVKVTEDTSCLNGTSNWRWNDRALSLTVEYNRPPPECIWVYEHSCYSGSMSEICQSNPDLTSANMNDKISSVRLGERVSIIMVYTDINFEGSASNMIDDVANLDGGYLELFDENISSLKIVLKPSN